MLLDFWQPALGQTKPRLFFRGCRCGSLSLSSRHLIVLRHFLDPATFVDPEVLFDVLLLWKLLLIGFLQILAHCLSHDWVAAYGAWVLTAHELGVEVYPEGCLFIEVWHGGASLLEDFLIALHWLARAPDSVENFWGYQGLRWPFIEWWSVVRMPKVLNTVGGKLLIVLSVWSRKWGRYIGFGKPRLRPVYVTKWFERFLIWTDWKSFFRLPLKINTSLLFLECCTLRSISILASGFFAGHLPTDLSLVCLLNVISKQIRRRAPIASELDGSRWLSNQLVIELWLHWSFSI